MKTPRPKGHKHDYALDSYAEDPRKPRVVIETFKCGNSGCPKPVVTRRVAK